MNSHHISDESIAALVQHSDQIKEHGQQIEQLGTTLIQNQQAEVEDCQVIQAIGQQIQKHGQAALELAAIAQQNRAISTDVFVQAGMEHAEAIRLHVKVNRILMRLHQPALPNHSSAAIAD